MTEELYHDLFLKDAGFLPVEIEKLMMEYAEEFQHAEIQQVIKHTDEHYTVVTKVTK
ncbi:hypothetical protein [Sinobaca sp. H24]|uniref:hypothetical protein n=1 Tax=Sinobaca sp. H24 TaxID=2923376 RepID=UPI00207ADA67|nr:hypothetical protein [Sinobaca sp. H24]